VLELVGGDHIGLWQTLGIFVERAEVGRVRLRMPMGPQLGTYSEGIMHGGAVASLIDAASASATRTLQTADEPLWRNLATTDINVSYLEPARTEVVAEGRVLRAGRRTSFVQVDVHDADDRLVAVGRVTLAIRRAG
jgi:uncharacterized protein (TIGR00369 family)